VRLAELPLRASLFPFLSLSISPSFFHVPLLTLLPPCLQRYRRNQCRFFERRPQPPLLPRRHRLDRRCSSRASKKILGTHGQYPSFVVFDFSSPLAHSLFSTFCNLSGSLLAPRCVGSLFATSRGKNGETANEKKGTSVERRTSPPRSVVSARYDRCCFRTPCHPPTTYYSSVVPLPEACVSLPHSHRSLSKAVVQHRFGRHGGRYTTSGRGAES
jgi:hypothetical protein